MPYHFGAKDLISNIACCFEPQSGLHQFLKQHSCQEQRFQPQLVAKTQPILV